MIHGGGHVMLSRKDVRPKQTQMLLDAGFVPISIDYRLCPEVTLLEGPMQDAQDALAWARHTLPHIARARPDVRIDGTRVVAIGWSTGGTLALSMGWAPRVQPPEATLVFYCPYDYDDPTWSKENKPFGDAALSPEDYDVWESVADSPMTAYNPALAARIVLHMNWYGQTVPVLVHGLKKKQQQTKPLLSTLLPPPTSAQISAISPLAQVRQGNYRTPTFIIHPVEDDLIPWQQAQHMADELAGLGVEAHLHLIDDVVHLFDMMPRFDRHAQAAAAVKEGYAFLSRHAA
jgi:acetyl esterase/lipase